MAINFPASPSNGDTYTFGGVTYTYDSTPGLWQGNSSTADNSISASQLNVSGNGTSGQALTSDGDGSFSWTTLDSGGGGGGGLLGPWKSSVTIPNTSGSNNPGYVHGSNITIPSDATAALVRLNGNRNRRGSGGLFMRINGSTLYDLLIWTNNEENERGYAAGSYLLDLSGGTIMQLAAATSLQTVSIAQGSAAGLVVPLVTDGTAITSFNFGIRASGHSSASASIQSTSTVWFNA